MGRRAWVASGVLVLAGVVAIALPDDDVRIISFSRSHGPSLVDAFGILLIVVAWVFVVRVIWRGRVRLARSRVWRTLALPCVLAGTALIVWSVLGDHGAWWMLGAGILAALQVTAAATVSGPDLVGKHPRAMPARSR